MKLVKHWKLACASLLAVCCIGTAAAGFTLSGGTAAAAAEDGPAWVGNNAAKEVVGDVTVYDQSVTAVNNVDILSLPGHTGVFYMYYSDAAAGWSGFTLRNGNDGGGYRWDLGDNPSTDVFPWHSVCFDSGNKHMIFHDGRNFVSTGGTLGGINGVDGENFLDGFIPVEIHIGEGSAQNDPSYVKIGGVELVNEDNGAAITLPWTRASGSSRELTASMFTKGCHVAINYNVGASMTHEFALSNVGCISATDASMNKLESPHQSGDFKKDLTATLKSTQDVFAEGYKVTAKVNGHALADDAVTVTKTSDKEAAVTVSKETLSAIPREQLLPSTFFTFEVTNGDENYGSAAVATNVVFEEPPVLNEEDVDQILTSKAPFTYTFEYSGSEDPATSLEISYAISNDPHALTLGTDYTVTQDGTTYTVTITQAGVDKIFNGHVAASITLSFGPHVLRTTAFIDGKLTEYGIRYREGIDYVDGTLEQDEYYSSATIKKHNPATLSSRIFYEEPVDLSKPVFVEYATLDPVVDWMLISLMSSPKLSETFSNETSPAAGNLISFIMFGLGRHNMQGMNNSFSNGNTVEFSQNTNRKNNVVEIYLGATDKADGYVKVNGELIPVTPEHTQSEYPDGKAYVGLFFNNTQDFNFTVNTHVNPVAITSPQDDAAYTMDLGKAKDFVLDLANTDGNLTLKDETGETIPAAKYGYAGGKLTIKAEYFTGKSFTKEGTIYIWDNDREVGTAFTMTYSNSEMADVAVAYATKGALTDVVFDLGIASVEGILQKGQPVAASNYSAADGKLTIKKEALRDEKGVQEFLVTAGGKLYPCYVCVDGYANGYALAAGATVSGNDISLSGVTSAAQAKTYDLTEGFKLGFNFKKADVYHERAVNEVATSVTVRFLDPLSGNSLVITLYANFADDKITSSQQALFVTYDLYGESGAKLTDNTGRGVAPKEGANSAIGEHNLELKENNGGLTVTVAGRPYTLNAADLTGFNMKACILTVTTETATAGSETVVRLGGYDLSGDVGGDTPGTDPGTTPGGNTGDQGQPSEPEKKGCGGLIGGVSASVAAGIVLLAACVVLFVKKRRQE